MGNLSLVSRESNGNLTRVERLSNKNAAFPQVATVYGKPIYGELHASRQRSVESSCVQILKYNSLKSVDMSKRIGHYPLVKQLRSAVQ